MKKIIILSLSCLMILSFATTTLAISFYLDMITDGSYELTHEIAFDDDPTEKPDVSGYILGIDYPINRFKLGLEYIKTETDINADEKELSSIEIKGGFKFADNGRRVWHLTFCQLDNDYKAVSIKSSANLIGLDYLRHFPKGFIWMVHLRTQSLANLKNLELRPMTVSFIHIG